MPDGSASRGRPRSVETDRAIRTAALELLREAGPGAVNVEAVAARSGVARTTIYRRYASRDELMAAVLDDLVEPGAPAPELPVGEKLRWVLDQAIAVLEHGIGRGGLAAVLTGSDPTFTDSLRQRLSDQLATLTRAVLDDVEAGRVHDVDPETLVGLLFGACLAELLLHGELRPGWADRTVAFLTPAITAGGQG